MLIRHRHYLLILAVLFGIWWVALAIHPWYRNPALSGRVYRDSQRWWILNESYRRWRKAEGLLRVRRIPNQWQLWAKGLTHLWNEISYGVNTP